MANHQCRSVGNVTRVLLTFYIVTHFFMPLMISCGAHFIHIDDEHHEFRSDGFPRSHLPPPPLPPPPLEHPPPAPFNLPGRELSPAECMVDLTNDLTYRILHYHSILNRNNFAFSPTALMSVLVALYEGSTGRSAVELKDVLKFPNNRDIVRVGYRDVHRRLRTYFFGSDNPLNGLSLHKENVTITRDYEAILMFYGYDLGMDMVSSTAAPTTTSTSTTTTSTTPTTTSTSTTTPTTTEKETTTESTTESMKERVTSTAMTPLTTVATTTTEEVTTTTMETQTTTTPTPITTTTPTTTTLTTPITTTTTPTTTTLTTPTTTISSSPDTTTSPVPPDTTTEETTTETTATITSATETPVNEAVELISSFVAEAKSEPLLRIQKARVTRLPNAKLQAPPITKLPQINYLPSQRQSKRFSTERRKRHLIGFKEFDTNVLVGLLNSEPQLHNLVTGAGLHSPLASYIQVSHAYEVDTEPNFIRSSQAAKQNYNTDVITHVFYLSSQQVIYTTFKVYNAVLYYKYFEHLHMSVLELELDTPEYNLIIMLPDYNTDLVAAAASLHNGPRLRLLRKQLKPKWVQAVIPDFKLQGTMFLTNDLQNLGICDIFEPNRADFRPMTEEKGTYVKHIEQSINIHIRTHPINQLRRNTGAQAQPIQISVNHPFMFFIVDRDLDVAVMAGRILNPLNVRIQ